ncbi:MAG: precorrin-6A reductase [Clostridiales bacterium]|nr:precorrin-6A reductase [Clostridiales bacterium]
MKTELLIFGGTTEGREISLLAESLGYKVTLCVATDYGEAQMEKRENLKVKIGRLNEDEMAELISGGDFAAVIDASHPYATELRQNIIKACEKTSRRRLRLLREQSELKGCNCFDSLEKACGKASEIEGNILAVTGSKELLPYTKIKGWPSRVFVRVLPTKASLELCRKAGVPEENIIAAKGPFSKEENLLHLQNHDIKIMITKDGGPEGGFENKVLAAQSVGAKVFVVRRPMEEGHSFSQVENILREGL